MICGSHCITTILTKLSRNKSLRGIERIWHLKKYTVITRKYGSFDHRSPKWTPALSCLYSIQNKITSSNIKNMSENKTKPMNATEEDLYTAFPLFSLPKQMLNNLIGKTGMKLYDIYYIERGAETQEQGNWTCIYEFNWPVKMKFESTAKSKSKAGEQAARSALQWLYRNGHINKEGDPLIQKEKMKDQNNSDITKSRGGSESSIVQRVLDIAFDDIPIPNTVRLLFPSPRQTLNNYMGKIGKPIYKIQYGRKKSANKAIKSDWICTYTFVWPEVGKFEGTGISKNKAADQAATLALNWLYINRHINKDGNLIIPKEEYKNKHKTLDSHAISINISEGYTASIKNIKAEYEYEIKNIYENTFKEAQESLLRPSALLCTNRELTLEEQDEIAIGEPDIVDVNGNVENLKVHPVFGKVVSTPTVTQLMARETKLRSIFEKYDATKTTLPIDVHVPNLVEIIDRNRVVVVDGATGSGKSTRVAPAVLKHHPHSCVIVTQPRRLPAYSLACRLAREFNEQVGETVGYQMRLDSCCPRPPGGSILYCTSGVLLKRLQYNPGLEGCTHIIIDEAHERDVNTDLMLLLLKRSLSINPGLKLVVMSATLDTGVFSKYFGSCPIFPIPGKAYPVEILHLEEIQNKFHVHLKNSLKDCTTKVKNANVDCSEVVQVIQAVDRNQSEGAILVFLPGWQQIKRTDQLLRELYGNADRYMILRVHSRLSTEEQNKIFSVPPPGVRKIVLATNIAETSITIPDVVHVIDTGTHKEFATKEGAGVAGLGTVWVSQAAAKQRAGRAGRVQSGYCYRLYTKDKEAEFAKFTTPEILRIPLEQVVLDCKGFSPDEKIADFLSNLPDPPSPLAVQKAVDDLKDLGALSSDERVTRSGLKLLQLGMWPRLAATLLNAAVCGDVTSVATLCAAAGVSYSTTDCDTATFRDIKKQHHSSSDHVALVRLQQEYEQAEYKQCFNVELNQRSFSTVQGLTRYYIDNLTKCGIMNWNSFKMDQFSNEDQLVPALLLSGFNQLLCTKQGISRKNPLNKKTKIITTTGDKAEIGRESINYDISKRKLDSVMLLAYSDGFISEARRSLVVYNTSIVSPHIVLLFCKGDVIRHDVENNITKLRIDRHNLNLEIPTSQADLILQLREMLQTTLTYYMERDTNTIIMQDEVVDVFRTNLLKLVLKILKDAHTQHVLPYTALQI